MVEMEMTMTFNEAVEVVKEYTGCGGMLLDGLEQVELEMQDEEFPPPRHVTSAFRFICAKMRPLFV